MTTFAVALFGAASIGNAHAHNIVDDEATELRNPGPDQEVTYASGERMLHVADVRGLVVGRSLPFLADGDVEGAASIVRPKIERRPS